MFAPERRKPWTVVALAGVVTLLAILKAYGVRPALSDENIYFYLATRLADGRLPYGDFSFAHPPVHLLLALPVAFLHPTLVAFKLIPVVAVIATAIALYVHASRDGALLRGVLAALFFSFSHDVLRSSSHFTGATEACALMALGLALWRVHAVSSGVCFGLAAGTALYLSPALAGVMLVMFLVERTLGRTVIIAAAATVLAWNVLGLVMGGGRFLDDVYFYHFAKTESEDALTSALIMVGFHQTFLMFSFVPVAALALLQWRRPLREAVRDSSLQPLFMAAAGSVATVVFLATQPRVFHFYLLPALTLLPVLLGHAVAALLTAARTRAYRKAAVLVTSLALVQGAHELLYRALPYAKRQWGTTHRYTFKPAALPGPINDAMRVLFWRDARIIGDDYLGITYALWHESLEYAAADAVAADVARLTAPGETILGDSLAAPLAALMAHRHIAADIADTNTQRFKSGKVRVSDVIARAEADRLALVVVQPGTRFAGIPDVQEWLRTRFVREAVHDDGEKGRVELWRMRR